MSELKRCPFCGGEAFYIKIMGNYDKPHEIYCSKCDGAITEGQSEKQVVTNWNTRPIEDALKARIAELEAENAELKERVAMLDVTAVYKSLGEMGYIEQVVRLNARIAELEAAQRWIPVSERLPEDGEIVCLLGDGYLGMGYYLIFSGCFMDKDSSLKKIIVTHWMPLPELPEVK